MAKLRKGKTFIELYGKKKAKEIGKKISKKVSKRQKGKTWEESWGEESANNAKKKLSKRSSNQKNMLGKNHSEKTKKLFSEQRKGSKNPSWKGGKSKEGYSWNFRKISKEIRERDNYQCKLCKRYIKTQTKKEFLTAHHIDYNKLNNSYSNLITLCSKCNSIVNFSREEWEIYFNKIMVDSNDN